MKKYGRTIYFEPNFERNTFLKNLNYLYNTKHTHTSFSESRPTKSGKRKTRIIRVFSFLVHYFVSVLALFASICACARRNFACAFLEAALSKLFELDLLPLRLPINAFVTGDMKLSVGDLNGHAFFEFKPDFFLCSITCLFRSGNFFAFIALVALCCVCVCVSVFECVRVRNVISLHEQWIKFSFIFE